MHGKAFVVDQAVLVDNMCRTAVLQNPSLRYDVQHKGMDQRLNDLTSTIWLMISSRLHIGPYQEVANHHIERR